MRGTLRKLTNCSCTERGINEPRFRVGDFALALSLNSISRFTRELPDEGALI